MMPGPRQRLVESAVLPLVPLVPAALVGMVSGGADLGPARWAGVALVAAGLGFWLWAVVALLRGGSSPSTTRPGELVVSGPYRYSRNPMYVGVVVALLGEAVAFESALVAVLAAVALVLFDRLVRWEEAGLRESLGGAFEAYCEQVPRWLGPPR
ncbi:MAG: isoprenylcysteine carboxylmethyltransferase family protein [Halobacteriaceae archaeon]